MPRGLLKFSSRAMRLAKQIAGVQDVLTSLLIITSHPNDTHGEDKHNKKMPSINSIGAQKKGGLIVNH